MGHKKSRRRERLRRIAAGLAAAAAAIVPGTVVASGASSHEAVEAETRTTPPARLLELAGAYPAQVLANRALRRLRQQDPDVHRDIVLAARFGRAEAALAESIARADRPTLRLFACDCAARVVPLYEKVGLNADQVARARQDATAMLPAAARAPANASPQSVLDMAFTKAEADVEALERAVDVEASLSGGAASALAHLVFAAGRSVGVADESPFRAIAVAKPAAEAIDHALLIAAGGTVDRIGPMCDAIAEAIYLETVFATGKTDAAIDAVFRELAWQRGHLAALRAR